VNQDSDDPNHEEPKYFHYSARLRIFGEHLDFEEIGWNLGLTPVYTHRKGDRKGPRTAPFRHDMWAFSPDIDENEDLFKHIDALWAAIGHSKQYLLSLKSKATVDVFLGYRSNVTSAGFDIPYTSLNIFIELQIPFGISIIAW
jgi:hypothetical protein